MSRTYESPSRRRVARSLGLIAAASALAAGVPTLASAADGSTVLRAQSQTVRPQIAGGSQIQITRAPWQVYIEQDQSTPQEPDRVGTCGGSIVDATHIVTAAHCTFAEGNTAQDDPSKYTVVAGVSDLADAPTGEPGDDPQTRTGAAIASVTRHPGYSSPGSSGTVAQFVNDVAVITLATPLTLNGTTAAAVPLPAAGPNPGPGSVVFVSGFGLQREAAGDPTVQPNGHLYGLDTALVDASLRDAAGPYNALYLVTQSTNGSTCQGDSGGGLVQGATLVGVVSTGARCGVGEVGNFTALTAGENLTFVRNVVAGRQDPIPRAPVGGSEVSLRTPTSPQVGDTLTCSPGGWSNGPTFVYQFVDGPSGTLLQDGPSATYRPTAGDVGRRISCRVTAVTAGGVGRSLPTEAAAAVRALPTPKPAAKPDPARLRAAITSGSSRVKQGSRVAFRVTVRNTGDVAAKSVRTCVRVNSRFSVVSRGGAKLTGGRLCWTTSSLKSSTTKRFSLRADRDAKAGRVATTVSVTSPAVRSASARRVVTIARRPTATSPGGVTG